MNTYAKLFSSIVHSTIWREPDHVRLVWITMLAISDRHGQVAASLPGLADVARVTLDQCSDAISKLSAPDEYSRSKDYEGRRIADMPGGWLILNYARHRDTIDPEIVREQTRLRVKRFREKSVRIGHQVTPDVTLNAEVTPGNDIRSTPTPTPTPTETSTDLSPSAPSISTPSKALVRIPKNGTQASQEATVLAGRYLQTFNAVYARRLGLVPKIATMVEAQLKRGSAPWQIVALPIMVAGRQPGWKPEADHLLRDGTHKHTGPDGRTSGDTDWLAREMLSLDRLVLDARLAAIARQAGVLDALMGCGVGLREDDI
jgi:hypothetical protein